MMSVDMPKPLRSFASVLWAIVLLSVFAGGASADFLYQYSEPFEFSSGCSQPTIEISVVFEEAIPPNTPVPPSFSQNPGIVSASFSACGYTCPALGEPCTPPRSGGATTSLRFGTDANADVVNWYVSRSYGQAGSNQVTISTQLPTPTGGGVESDLFYDALLDIGGGSTQMVGTWTVTEIGGAVPATDIWGRLLLIAGLVLLASCLALRVRSSDRRAGV